MSVIDLIRRFLTPIKGNNHTQMIKSVDEPEPTQNRTIIVAQLNARIQPLDRGEYFEDPLDEMLRRQNLGMITGGGTLMGENGGEIVYCDIEITLNNLSDDAISVIICELERLGAPKGSIIRVSDKTDDIPFGKLEGLGIYLNGTDLPNEVYSNSDVNVTISQIDEVMGEMGDFRGHWIGERETALYFYGADFKEMESAIAEYVKSDPLCTKSRIIQIA